MVGDYERYIELVDEAVARPAQRSAQLDELTRQNGDELKATERQHKSLEMQVAKTNDDLRRIKGQIERLARSASVPQEASDDLPPLASLADADRLMKSMAGDLRSAEDAVEWLQRARAERPRPAPVQAPVAPITPPPVAAAPKSGSRTILVAIGVGVSVTIIVALMVLVL